MLISPSKIHAALTSVLSPNHAEGPHTALLITPQGRLMSRAAINLDDDQDSDDGNGKGEGGVDEAYLDPPARVRLLLGLASQWNEASSAKMECELGRLHFTSLSLGASETPSPSVVSQNLLPESKPAKVDRLLLVLNGRGTGWNVLAAKSEEFKKAWKS
ncbi:hypothetical protein L202_04633 [Cryptococcus amylolentus CBS 6039]|uniref:Roadblock/LAMTOR2 domain-containing protein n=2 Tax=Cryptococcus amylolentus TaxID=104669 RepID=A0A1E3HMR4_9TREE|nr:hypothetical protein L202_04633 [Cryptococcus amylolentus CBS 6039]ODN77455.1 hypothetical protein L202_04633 [Cryptococcus amylolentus CBS 6039]ODO05508.1 hypothetical protein I350_04559 [Cryptococcus amylolentus CBS 6273]